MGSRFAGRISDDFFATSTNLIIAFQFSLIIMIVQTEFVLVLNEDDARDVLRSKFSKKKNLKIFQQMYYVNHFVDTFACQSDNDHVT